MTKTRTSGILLHITSLPSRFGIGDLGPGAFRFADFLKKAKQSYWQILPLNPPASFNSPYSSMSAFAGNTLLISPELLYRDGLLAKKDIKDAPAFPETAVDYRAVSACKSRVLNTACERFFSRPKPSSYERFCRTNRSWLEDFAMFVALREHFPNRPWPDWPIRLRDRNKQTLKSLKSQLQDKVKRQKFLQYIFFKQWLSLKAHCRRLGIKIIGDVPMYVAYDSADVWANPQIFKLTKTKQPRVVSGVPPDDFSKTGQLWGTPVYAWDVLKRSRYRWWIDRIEHNLKLFDAVRLDHFCGFASYYEVPAGEKTAVKGKWVPGPREHFFNALIKRRAHLPLIAEDLGIITPKVIKLRDRFGLAGTKVLLFAFADPSRRGANPHLPHTFVRNCVVYTGTHDTNTARGWFESQAKRKEKQRLFACLGRKVSARQIHWELIRLAMASVGNVVIVPLQDVLGLRGQARMNRPGTAHGNWRWRFTWPQLKPSAIKKLAEMTKTYTRV